MVRKADASSANSTASESPDEAAPKPKGPAAPSLSKWTRYRALQLSRKTGIAIALATERILEEERQKAEAKRKIEEDKAQLRLKRKQLESDPEYRARAEERARRKRAAKKGRYVKIYQGGAPGSGKKH